MSSEEVIRRAISRPRPETLMAPPDGQKLEQIISELQSVWGVPQYPQEYRITIKVADEKEARVGSVKSPARGEGAVKSPSRNTPAVQGEAASVGEGPRREKAPAAPRVGSVGEPGDGSAAPKRRRRRGRRGRRPT